jgi:hypothetical protein
MLLTVFNSTELATIDLTNICRQPTSQNCIYWDSFRGNFPNSNTAESQGADVSSSLDPAWVENPRGENYIYYDTGFDILRAAPNQWIGSESAGLGFDRET